MDYNKTLNLPKTDFPMRAGLPQREPVALEAWKAKDIYGKLQKKNEGKPSYILHDGPPFSNGDIHMGHALNKILKDFIIRYKAMSGYYAPYVPGWDNHGMPIESAIIKKNKLDRKKMSIPEFRDACTKFASDFVDRQRSQFIRLGVLGDWDHPYLAMNPEFEAEEVKVFGEMFKKGYIYKGLKPVYWCPHDETALAEAEIEYKDDTCTSIFVKFRVKDDKGILAPHCDLANTYFVIWTTTTWTLPGNLAIALNPSEKYALIKADNGEYYITATALAENTMKVGKIASYEIVAEFKGHELEYITASHPFIDRDSLVVLAEYVTMDSGTGCVHTAPGFGADDYNTCRKYNMDLIVPVDDRGYQTADAGKFAGMYYEESNKAILADMQESGALFASEVVAHSYPHCWRCKNPIIFRATPQWFCSVESFKDAAIENCQNVTWLPAWGKDRIESMIRERADWCISRQRHWGLPIPVFYCEDCGKPVCTDESIEAVSKLFAEKGSNAWYESEASDILPEAFTCPHCGGKHFVKESDTLDCWFDSGSTHIASLKKDHPEQWPADMYLEGADQYRGWFQSSLLTSVATSGKAPYRNVLTHGWVVDGEGKAMHKSLGNSIAPEEIIKKYGADLLRMWVASSDYRVDVRVSDDIFKQLSQAYLKIRNTCRFLLGNLNGFEPDRDLLPYKAMEEIDRWALTRLNALVAKCLEAYDNYEYHIVYHSIRNFCVVELSNFYLDVIKDRLYCEPLASDKRRSAASAMYLILDGMVRLLTPILAFTADEIWTFMPHTSDVNVEAAIFNDMAKVNPMWEDASLSEKWAKLLDLRDTVKKAMEEAKVAKSLETKVILSAAEDYDFLVSCQELLPTIFISSSVELVKADVFSCEIVAAEGEKCERCWTVSDSVGSDPEHPTLCARCAAAVRSL
ncbi:MAG: isoleucine--tRNA ligase [Clostridia bacterium]|nr:isoleucine--tRNA ligase [Clostridia bacterium]